MDIRDRFAHTITEHGHAVLSISTDHPDVPAHAYTMGRALRGRPELVVFGLDPTAARSVLNEIVRLDSAGADLSADELELWPGDGSNAWVQLGRVHPMHLEAFLPLATHQDGLPVRLRAVQVSVPESATDHAANGPSSCGCCPDLTRQGRPWALPFDPPATHLRRRTPDEVAVCLPVIGPGGEDEGRVEVVACQRMDDTTVEVLEAPVLADWTTAGAVLELAGQRDESGLPFAAVERRRSPLVHLAWWLHGCALGDPDSGEQLASCLDRVAALDGVAVTWTAHWLAIAAPPRHAPRVRSAARRLVRDGFAQEAAPRSAAPGPCVDPSCHGASPC